ncbi:uncharacterized protein C8orf76 homolog [Amphibalanus amphitrite]|uniref:uncharacterized protein C8orf76 homolog n=1 Tax=Amphibalanus amphitrite TaxID=1232801 RepID=UPI001C906E6F|nr:uncharacterized protein C8orf76 homolog [Amphibalanus amphitrite]
MDLGLQFSDDDLEPESSLKRPAFTAADYVPKFEDPRWYADPSQLPDPSDDNQMPLYFHANKLAVDGRHAEALAIYELLLDRSTRNSASTRELLDSCARCLLRLGRPEEALLHLERSRGLLQNRDHLLVWAALAGDTQRRLGRPERALPLQQAAVAADEQSPLAWLALAHTYGALADAGHRPQRSRRLRRGALLWARAALAEATRAARSFVAEAALGRLREVDAALAGEEPASEELNARLRQRLMWGAGPAPAQGDDEFVDRGSSKFQEKVDGVVQWEVSCEEFERKWFELFSDDVDSESLAVTK